MQESQPNKLDKVLPYRFVFLVPLLIALSLMGCNTSQPYVSVSQPVSPLDLSEFPIVAFREWDGNGRTYPLASIDSFDQGSANPQTLIMRAVATAYPMQVELWCDEASSDLASRFNQGRVHLTSNLFSHPSSADISFSDLLHKHLRRANIYSSRLLPRLIAANEQVAVVRLPQECGQGDSRKFSMSPLLIFDRQQNVYLAGTGELYKTVEIDNGFLLITDVTMRRFKNSPVFDSLQLWHIYWANGEASIDLLHEFGGMHYMGRVHDDQREHARYAELTVEPPFNSFSLEHAMVDNQHPCEFNALFHERYRYHYLSDVRTKFIRDGERYIQESMTIFDIFAVSALTPNGTLENLEPWQVYCDE